MSGPEVKEYQAEHEGEITRVRISLAGVSRLPTLPPFRGSRPGAARRALERARHASPRRDLDRRHHDGGRRPLARDPGLPGTRRPARAGHRESEPVDANVLVFEARSADPVADLVFRQTRLSRRARYAAGCWSARQRRELECQTDRHRRPRLSEGAEHRVAAGLDCRSRALERRRRIDSLASDHSGGRQHPAALALSGGEELSTQGRALEIMASSAAAGGRGPLDSAARAALGAVHRRRDLGCHGRPNDDPHADLGARPRLDRSFPGASWSGPELYREIRTFHTALAWRWNGENATARVDRERAEQEPRAEIQYRARIEQDGKHLAVEGQILIRAGSNPLDVLPVWIGQSAGAISGLVFSRADPKKERIAQAALWTSPSRSVLELPATGLAWSLSVRVPELGESRVHFKARLPWNQRGSVPLMLPAREFLPRSTVLLEVPPRMRSDVQTSRLRRLETTMAERLAASWRPAARAGPGRTLAVRSEPTWWLMPSLIRSREASWS